MSLAIVDSETEQPHWHRVMPVGELESKLSIRPTKHVMQRSLKACTMPSTITVTIAWRAKPPG